MLKYDNSEGFYFEDGFEPVYTGLKFTTNFGGFPTPDFMKEDIFKYLKSRIIFDLNALLPQFIIDEATVEKIMEHRYVTEHLESKNE